LSRRRRIAIVAAAVGVVVAGAAFAATQLSGSASAAVPHYVDEAIAAGVVHSYQGDFDYYVGGGVAAFDCNGDALADLYLAGGSAPAQLFVNRSPRAGALAFVAAADPATDLLAVTGAYPVDFDSDGVTDLMVLRHGENVILRGLGGCRFERANEEWSFDGGDEWSAAFSAKWDRGAAWPTIAIGNYLGPEHPDGTQDCVSNLVYQPRADGPGFAAPATLTPSWCTLSMLFTDWDRSGRRDLRVSNDRHYYGDVSGGQEQLWQVLPGAPPREYTAADGWKPLRIWGMGIADYDVTGDGYPDYYLTSQADNKLQVLAGDAGRPSYADKALAMHATATRPYVGDTTLPSTAWHSEFQDVNNDAFVDLFVAKGNVDAQADFAIHDPSDLLIGQPDGTFRESGTDAGVDSFARARGAAMVDLNADGMLDLVVVDRVSNVRVYRNVGTGTAQEPHSTGNWIGLSLAQPGPDRNAIGAWLEVRVAGRVAQREVTVGGGHASGELVPLHFGLGQSTQADVRVTWPDGTIGDWQTVNANATYLVQPRAQPQAIEP
jgi:hypothetical protein